MDLKVDPLDILTLDEIRCVLTDGERRAKRSRQSAQNTLIFRLAVGCGLRAAEIAGLQLRDVRTDSDAPFISVRKATAKRGKPRKVPLAWDQGTLHALRAWKAARLAAGAVATDPVVCVQVDRPTPATPCVTTSRPRSAVGGPLSRIQVARKFKVALRALPLERREHLHTHSGRHSFASYMVREHPLPAVRDALGHASVATTSIYLHMDPGDFVKKGSVFTFGAVSPPGNAVPTASEPPPNATGSAAP